MHICMYVNLLQHISFNLFLQFYLRSVMSPIVSYFIISYTVLFPLFWMIFIWYFVLFDTNPYFLLYFNFFQIPTKSWSLCCCALCRWSRPCTRFGSIGSHWIGFEIWGSCRNDKGVSKIEYLILIVVHSTEY